jgi:methyltransferase family protein
MPPALHQLRQSLKNQLVRVSGRLIYFGKLRDGLRKIRTDPLASLRRVDHVEQIIAGIGLAYDRRRLYGDDNRYMNILGPGLWQIPRQLAQALCFLSGLAIRTGLEIGTYQGWTACVLAAYLQRFNKDFCLTTIDPVVHFTAYASVRDQLPLVYLAGQTSADIAHKVFDLCLIDGDHSYTACAQDYKLCGRFARVCMFHDINDQFRRI